MKKTTLMTSLLLAWCGYALAEPLTFGWLESGPARRQKFEKHFLRGDTLQQFAVGKKQVTLPAGSWVISQVHTYAPDMPQAGRDDAGGATADAALGLQDPQSGDRIYLQTLISPPSSRIWLASLSDSCRDASQAKDGTVVYQQQLDSKQTDRQSCVTVSGRKAVDQASGEARLVLTTSVMESRDGDYLAYFHTRTVALPAGQASDLAALDKPTRAFIASQLRWGVALKADIARRMGW
ncbi:hypothetical protein PQU95_17650 [Vogesella sp. DC21W]|uniref:Lipoprotein n=1 Tax=Vogesella aquatica TaxID=2984206 RepID=A0ABT5J3B4_9NEIS|nr:hypothetical protein [Vogesella aquatica]MDC7719030.1 hypothetical protein [Vogesella aquatica]